MARRRNTPPAAPDPNTIHPSDPAAAAGAFVAAASAPQRSDDEEWDGVVAEGGDVFDLVDARYADWKWYVYRQKAKAEMLAEPGSAPRVLVTKVLGPLDSMQIQEEHGGGVFEFWGFFDGKLRRRVTAEIAGPRKNYMAPPVVVTTTPPPVAPAPAPFPDPYGRRMDRLENLLEQLLTRPAPAPPPPQGLGFEQAIQLFTMMQQSVAPPGGNIRELVEVFKLGAEVRNDIEPGAAKSTGEMVLDRLVPVAERLATVIMSRTQPPTVRRPAPPPPGPSGHPAVTTSSAQVVDETPAATAAPPASDEDVEAQSRIIVLVGAVVRAIQEKRDPEDFAVTVDEILSPDEVALLEHPSTTVDALLAQMNAVTGGRHTTLGAIVDNRFVPSQDARAFVEAVLVELRRPDDDVSTASPA